MKKIRLLLLIIGVVSSVYLFAQDAPIATIGNVASTGTTITVPVTAVNFINVASCNQEFYYDPSIATATTVTLGPSMVGGLSINIATPGVITIGWFTYPGLTLPDNSVIFNITFSKVALGTTIVQWNTSYLNRNWGDGNFIIMNDLPFADYYIDGSATFQGDAPITIAPVMTACPGNNIQVPITVLNFNTIGAVSLTLFFNPAVLQYQSFINSGPFPGLQIQNPTAGVITVSGFVTNEGVTLPDNATFFALNFAYLGGTTGLNWFDDGESCEYAGAPMLYPVLIDTPTSTYYIDGEITEYCISQWTGNLDSDWFNPGNWTQGVPYTLGDAIIPMVDPNPYPVITGDGVCRNADIAAGASLTISSSATLTAIGDFNNDGELIIESTPTGDGSFIDNGTITGLGVAKVQRYLESQMWHYVSPPISNAKSNIFFDIYLRSYLEPTGEWFEIIPTNVNLLKMEGFAAWASDALTGSTTVQYSGMLNTGPQSLSLTHTVGQGDGYNFVGNPYPSAIDWDDAAGWTKTNLDNAIYLWNPSIQNYGSYVGGVGVNGATNIIPSGQGFFIHVTDGFTTGSLGVNTDARLHDDKAFWKSSKTGATIPFLRLQVKAEGNVKQDEVLFRFMEEATVNFDPAFDAYKLTGTGLAPQFYSMIGAGERLSINSLPELNENIIIPIGFEALFDDFYTITTSELLNFQGSTKIILEDKHENVFTDLTLQDFYNFYGEITDDNDRFNLHFLVSPESVMDIAGNSNVMIFGEKNNIYIQSQNDLLLKGEVTGYDATGRIILKESINNVTRHEINTEFKGIMVVTFMNETDNQFYSGKVFLK